jgi:hypothetical protein
MAGGRAKKNRGGGFYAPAIFITRMWFPDAGIQRRCPGSDRQFDVAFKKARCLRKTRSFTKTFSVNQLIQHPQRQYFWRRFYDQIKILIMRYIEAETSAEIGIVITHAHRIRRATDHLTEESPRVTPTPMIAPVIVCVVLTGMPAAVAPKMVIAPAVSALNPPGGSSLVIFEPIVFITFHPPARVPSDIAE